MPAPASTRPCGLLRYIKRVFCIIDRYAPPRPSAPADVHPSIKATVIFFAHYIRLRRWAQKKLTALQNKRFMQLQRRAVAGLLFRRALCFTAFYYSKMYLALGSFLSFVCVTPKGARKKVRAPPGVVPYMVTRSAHIFQVNFSVIRLIFRSFPPSLLYFRKFCRDPFGDPVQKSVVIQRALDSTFGRFVCSKNVRQRVYHRVGNV